MDNRYVCQAESFQLYDADEEKGTAEQIGVKLRVIEGPETGRDIFWYGSLHENAQEFTAQALRDMGWSCNDITACQGLGRTKVHVVEKHDTYTDSRGKTRKSVKWQVWPIRTPKPTLEADKTASFAAKFKALAASVKPVERTEHNAGLDELPPPKAPVPTNGTASGPALSGTPF